MRTLLLTPALVLGSQIHASDFHVVVRTTDAVVVTVTVACPGDSTGLVALQQYEVRQPGSATYRVVGGVPPYRLLPDEPGAEGIVCFTVVDATGREARGCGVIGEMRSNRTELCNGGGGSGIPLFPDGPVQASVVLDGAEILETPTDDEPDRGPRVVRRTASKQDPTGGRPPIVREDRLRDVQPPTPAPRPQQRDALRPGGTPPLPSPRRTTGTY